MKFLLAALSLSLLFTAAASAANGRYDGRGTLEIGGRPTVNCDRVRLDISDDSWSITIREFTFDCEDGTRGSMDYRRFDVHGDDIYFEGRRVGRRVPGATEIQIREPDTGVILGMRFNERYYDTVDVVQELAAPNFAQRLTASLRRY